MGEILSIRPLTDLYVCEVAGDGNSIIIGAIAGAGVYRRSPNGLLLIKELEYIRIN